jgi:hypothetical protein
MGAAGLPSPTAEDLVRLRAHDVTPAFVRDMAAAGWRGLSTDDLVRLRAHGVTPSFARKAREKFGDATVDELIQLRAHTSL